MSYLIATKVEQVLSSWPKKPPCHPFRAWERKKSVILETYHEDWGFSKLIIRNIKIVKWDLYVKYRTNSIYTQYSFVIWSTKATQ